jgi:hypothetical protein
MLKRAAQRYCWVWICAIATGIEAASRNRLTTRPGDECIQVYIAAVEGKRPTVVVDDPGYPTVVTKDACGQQDWVQYTAASVVTIRTYYLGERRPPMIPFAAPVGIARGGYKYVCRASAVREIQISCLPRFRPQSNSSDVFPEYTHPFVDRNGDGVIDLVPGDLCDGQRMRSFSSL